MLMSFAQPAQSLTNLLCPFVRLSPGPLSAAERASTVRALPKGVIERARGMLAALDGKDVAAFQEALDDTADACGVRLKKLDKKLERSLLHAHRKVTACET